MDYYAFFNSSDGLFMLCNAPMYVSEKRNYTDYDYFPEKEK